MSGPRAKSIPHKVGRLTPTYQSVASDQHGALFHCRCDCGAQIIVSGRSLRRGNTRSCGCLRREHGAQVLRIARETRG